MTPEERAEILTECKAEAQREALRVMEGWLLRLPEIIGSLIMQKTSVKIAAEKLFNENPEFMKYQQLVAEIIRKVDSENPGMQFEGIMKLALPEINGRIKQTQGLNMASTVKPNDITFKPFNGEL